MKRLRLEKWPAQLLAARSGVVAASRPSSRLSPLLSTTSSTSSSPARLAYRRHQSTEAGARPVEPDLIGQTDEFANTTTTTPTDQTTTPSPDTTASAPSPDKSDDDTIIWPRISPSKRPGQMPSPLPSSAPRSAKLSALHARLSLPDRIPLKSLARTLVDSSADPAPLFNNVNLAFLGQSLINYHTSEMLMCRYPRLPMQILHAAMRAYAGDRTLYYVARAWGVEAAAAPGSEVDPGLLQFSLDTAGPANTKWGYVRKEAEYIEKYKWRRGISSRVVMDDDFGDALTPSKRANKPVSLEDIEEEAAREEAAREDPTKLEETKEEVEEMENIEMSLPLERQLALGNPDEKMAKSHAVHGTFVRALVGVIYAYAGREAARSFVKSHILSRQLDLAQLFSFKAPIRELARLCAREEFEPPVARLLSETGRLSRTPVYVVGIFSGNDKLGEGTAASLGYARQKAAMNALKAWYLYSPGEDVRVPSDMLAATSAPWQPVYIDIGEVL